ncbi:hypothetical protein C9374_001435 [Naegleria lovaniensis]|uniref:Protein kinase domain-containing protein n=1 Tax=Naegleria lovaniensis TaxID=51637 RepID=A0AA88GT09_NAELO|nr:uncharacterized protein C9374_001435 [Naegleria lovaniensis]KAG2387841.1 hypothetical protein C9374_001435 [Naegleria lovaniensis]
MFTLTDKPTTRPNHDADHERQLTCEPLAISWFNNHHHQLLLSQCKYLKLKEDRITVYSDSTLSRVVELYIVRKRLGRGAGGSVFMCEQLQQGEEKENVQHHHGKIIALKSVLVEDEACLENAVEEYSLLVKMNQNGRGHDFRITPVYDIYIDIQQEFNVYVMYFSMPVYKNDLEKFIKSPLNRKTQCDVNCSSSREVGLEGTIHQGVPTKFQVALSVATNISKALSHIHKNNIVHRDIKLANILIEDVHSDGLSVVLADFGLSKEIEESSRHSKVGTLTYLSPEVLSGQEYGFRVDCFALGVVLYQILTLDFTKRIAWDLLQHSEQQVRDDLKSKMVFSLSNKEVDFIDLVLEMLHKDPHKRIHSTAIYHFCLMKKTKSRKMQINQVTLEKNTIQPLPPPRNHLSEAQQKILVTMRQQLAQIDSEKTLEKPQPESEELFTRYQSLADLYSMESEHSTKENKEMRRRSKSFVQASQRTELVIHVYPHTFASSFKRLFTKSEEKRFNSIEAALIYAKKQPSSVHVIIYLHPGVHKHRQADLNIERENLTIEGVEEGDEEAVLQAERITILHNAEIRKMNFVGRKLTKGSLLTKPIIIEIDQCQPRIVNCKIKGRIHAIGRSSRISPMIEENEIFGNCQAPGNDAVGSALYFEGCCPQILSNKVHDNEVQANSFFDNGACILIANSIGSINGNEFKNCKKGIAIKDSNIDFHENELTGMKEWCVAAKSHRFSALSASISVRFADNMHALIMQDNLISRNMGGGVIVMNDTEHINNCTTNEIHITNNRFMKNGAFCMKATNIPKLNIKKNIFTDSLEFAIVLDQCAGVIEDNVFSDHLFASAIKIKKSTFLVVSVCDNRFSHNTCFDVSLSNECCHKSVEIQGNHFSGTLQQSIDTDLERLALPQIQQDNTFNEEIKA